jgi:hypothetical protein
MLDLGAIQSDVVAGTPEIDAMVIRLGADIFVSPSSGFCGYDSVSHRFDQIFKPDEPWSAGDVRAKLGQAYTRHQETLVAFYSNYVLLDKLQRRAIVKELNGRGADHKQSFNDDGTLPFKYWLKDVDIKCLAIELGVSLFVVSTAALEVTVIKYLSSVSAPGSVCINLKDMDMPDKARGESAVSENDIVMLYNGTHYNVLTWPHTPDNDGDDIFRNACGKPLRRPIRLLGNPLRKAYAINTD